MLNQRRPTVCLKGGEIKSTQINLFILWFNFAQKINLIIGFNSLEHKQCV